MRAVRIAMWQPANIRFQATFCQPDSPAPSHVVDCFYRSTGHYREDASGSLEYRYVTDGYYEVTSYFEKELGRTSGLVPRDADTSVFLEQFPARVVLDKELVFLGEREVSDAQGNPIETEVVATSFYDMYVRKGDHTIQEMVFYSRVDRHTPLVRISDIAYRRFAVRDLDSDRELQCSLPVGYTMHNNWGKRTTYRVTLTYKTGFTDPLSEDVFSLAIDRRRVEGQD